MLSDEKLLLKHFVKGKLIILLRSCNPKFEQINAAFTLNGFHDQERNLTFVKTDFQVLKLKFHASNFKQAFFPLQTLDTA